MTRTQWYIGAPNGVLLCIDGVEKLHLRGRLWHSYSCEALPFLDAQQMVLEMEKLYDLLNYPHPGTNERSFGPAKEPVRRENQEREKIMNDEDGTVSISVGKRHIIFVIGDYYIISRLLEGEFLNYKK